MWSDKGDALSWFSRKWFQWGSDLIKVIFCQGFLGKWFDKGDALLWVFVEQWFDKCDNLSLIYLLLLLLMLSLLFYCYGYYGG